VAADELGNSRRRSSVELATPRALTVIECVRGSPEYATSPSACAHGSSLRMGGLERRRLGPNIRAEAFRGRAVVGGVLAIDASLDSGRSTGSAAQSRGVSTGVRRAALDAEQDSLRLSENKPDWVYCRSLALGATRGEALQCRMETGAGGALIAKGEDELKIAKSPTTCKSAM